MASCDSCVYNVYDEDDEEYYCEVDMDEDDAARLMQGHYKECPYYQLDDEYALPPHTHHPAGSTDIIKSVRTTSWMMSMRW